MLASRARRALRRLTLAAAVAVIAVPWSPASPQAGHADTATNWQATHTEEFSGTSLPEGCGTYRGPYRAGKSVWMPDDVRVADGLLRLTLQRRTVKGLPWTSGGVGCWGWAQRYGRYEVRAKVPAGKGVNSYITLWPASGGEGSSTGVEVRAPAEETASVTNGYGTGVQTARVPGRYSDGFHTYVIEWGPSQTRVLVDNRVIHRSEQSYDGSRWLGMVVSSGDALTGVPDAATELPAEFQIDYVKVSSFTGSALAPRGLSRSSRKRSAPVTAGPTASVPAGGKGPVTTASPAGVAATATPAAVVDPAAPSLAGGVWPWLAGGVAIAALAVVTLARPGRRPAE